MHPRPPSSTLFPYTTLFRSKVRGRPADLRPGSVDAGQQGAASGHVAQPRPELREGVQRAIPDGGGWPRVRDRKSTRLNSSHITISYAVFCLKKTTTAYRITC